MKRIPVAGPSISEKEINYVTEAAATAWYGEANKFHERFESQFAEYLGAEHAISLPHCTSGIHLALAAWDIGPGDEVIVPDVTWIATSAPISYVGATPVFADVDENTWCLDEDSVRSLITERTRAILPVDLYGSLPNWDTLREIASANGLHLLEDAAEAVGSEWHGRRAGNLGDAGVFSFHGSKTLTTGEGGLLATSDTPFFERVKFLRDHGRVPGDVSFRNAEVAFKYKMSSMQAAMGLGQLERVEELVGMKRRIFRWYQDRLGSVKGLQLNQEVPGTRNSYWMTTVLIDPAIDLPKARLMDLLSRKGIDTRPFFSPLSSIPAYAAHSEAAAARERNVVSYRISSQGLNLPSGLSLDEGDVERVSAALLESIGLNS